MKPIKLLPSILLICILLLMSVGIGIGYTLGTSLTNPTGTSQISLSAEKKLHYVNFQGSGSEDYFKYQTGQVAVPGDYFATSDYMLVSYKSQGGMAPPVLTLTKGSQILTSDDSQYVYDDLPNDCILIWSTNGYTDMESWGNDLQRYDGKLINPESLAVETRTATMYETTNQGKGKYVAFLPLENKDHTSYYFETCNKQNKADFINVIKSLKLRADAKFN